MNKLKKETPTIRSVEDKAQIIKRLISKASEIHEVSNLIKFIRNLSMQELEILIEFLYPDDYQKLIAAGKQASFFNFLILKTTSSRRSFENFFAMLKEQTGAESPPILPWTFFIKEKTPVGKNLSFFKRWIISIFRKN